MAKLIFVNLPVRDLARATRRLVATLVMVRAEDRQRELAIRSALGAGRGRIVRTLALEALLLALVAAGIAASIAKIAMEHDASDPDAP